MIAQVRDGVLILGLNAHEQRFGPSITASEATPVASRAR
jgi:hypothetical protein